MTIRKILYKIEGKLILYFGNILSDKLFLKWKFRHSVGYPLNLKTPQSYNEKLQWLKLYDRNPQYTRMVDKYEAKKYVASIIGEEYIIPTLGVWDKFDDIDFDMLPQQFVLKTTHDSGGVIICRDKSKLDKATARKKLEESLHHDYYRTSKEWPYKNVKRRIIAEKYMEDESGELKDYKFFCFDGVPKALFIATDRFTAGEETKFDFFDMEFNHLPFINGHPNANIKINKPDGFGQMQELAAKLSTGIPHLRVDFYNINGRIYFGELTFYHWSGLVPFVPREWDYIFGQYIQLPIAK